MPQVGDEGVSGLPSLAGRGRGGWGMLSDPDKLIPLAPAPVRYQGKGGMFSRWW